MNPIKLGKLVILLFRLKKNEWDKQIHYYQKRLPNGTLVDIYRNHKKELSRLVLVHGMTSNGPRHPRLVHFAKTLAHEGLTCVIPKLNGLSSCRWEPDDLEQLIEAIIFSTNEINQQVGLIGFSYGGSYSLITACRGEMRKKVRRVITFGAYYNLHDLINSYLEALHRQPESNVQWEEKIYRHMAFVYGYGSKSLLPLTVRKEMEFIFDRYSYSTSSPEKQQFYRKYLQNLDIETMLKNSLSDGIFSSLSPAGNISKVCFPVTLIHARNDLVVPFSHAKNLYAELQHSPHPKMHQLVPTSALSHVTPTKLQKMREIRKLLKALAPIKENVKGKKIGHRGET
jgi:pimeloyl-ACP methyl ester carboxylesterase